MTWRSRCLVVALVLFAAACGGGDDDGESASDASATDDAPAGSSSDADDSDGDDEVAASAGAGSCSAVFSGDKEFRVDEPATIPANSDYWLTDDQLQQAAAVHDDFDERVASGQQLLQILQIACGEGDGVLFMSTDWTTRTDIPQGPGSYSVLNYLDKDKPGMSAAIVIPGDELFGVTGGTLTISRFDDKGVAGSFDLTAEELSAFAEGAPMQLTVTGEFDLPCWSGGGACE